MADIPVLNREAALERLGGDEELWREIVGMFLEDAPQQIASLTAALRSKEQDAVVRHAHSVKGSALNIGAEAVAATAAHMEKAAREGDFAVVQCLIQIATDQLGELHQCR